MSMKWAVSQIWILSVDFLPRRARSSRRCSAEGAGLALDFDTAAGDLAKAAEGQPYYIALTYDPQPASDLTWVDRK